MADFVAILRKTIDGLGENTPETRARVYAKARTTVEAKLAALNPPPPPAVTERQKKALEAAITSVESEYTKFEASDLDPVEELESAIASLGIVQPQQPLPAPKFRPAEPASLAPVQPAPYDPSEEDDFPHDDVVTPAVPDNLPSRRRRMPALLAALAALALVGGGAYAAWLNKNEIAALFNGGAPAPMALESVAPDAPGTEEEPQPEEEVAATAPEPQPAKSTADQQAAAAPNDEPEVALAEPQPEAEKPQPGPEATEPKPAAPAADAPPQKFTQRLRPDGTEVDEGPGGAEAGIGEGTSVAAATLAAAEALSSPAPQPAAQPPAEPKPAALAVAQRAIFYEERTNSEEGSAEPGTILWSLVQESPGGDLPPEPAIRAEATIPGKDLQLRMTIRRNADQTLPASHIVEMIFLTPENFEGGGIDNVLRIALKETEQAAGNPLLGIPAKIADGFFLVALTDGKAEIEANMTMLRRQSWIDIPIVYRSGRRALITMEKGIPGDKVFDEALKAWQAASSG